jgi:hypothetical protein
LEYNDVVFNIVRWPRGKMLQKVWLCLIDYDHLSWESAKSRDDGKFEGIWYRSRLLAMMVDGSLNRSL